jgi:cytochrome c-type biogenesis protein CcmH/NrfG
MCVAAQSPRRTRLAAALAAVLALVTAGAYFAPPWLSLSRSDSAATFAYRAYEAAKAKEYDKAIPLFRQAVEKNPNDATTWFYYGASLQHQGRLSEAYDAYLQAARLDPTQEHRLQVASVAAHLVWAELQEHEPDDARQILDRAMQAAPDDSTLWLWSGLTRQESGDAAGAIADWEKSLQLDPKNDEARKQLEAARTREK